MTGPNGEAVQNPDPPKYEPYKRLPKRAKRIIILDSILVTGLTTSAFVLTYWKPGIVSSIYVVALCCGLYYGRIRLELASYRLEHVHRYHEISAKYWEDKYYDLALTQRQATAKDQP